MNSLKQVIKSSMEKEICFGVLQLPNIRDIACIKDISKIYLLKSKRIDRGKYMKLELTGYIILTYKYRERRQGEKKVYRFYINIMLVRDVIAGTHLSVYHVLRLLVTT